MKIGFVGLGNVGAKLAATLLRHGYDLTVHDLNEELARNFVQQGCKRAGSAREMADGVDLIITSLPSPAASAAVVEGADGFLPRLRAGQVWLEMSTTDHAEIVRLGALVTARGGLVMDCPVSGGCHRAATGNIAIFAGGERGTFERVLPVLTTMGRCILYTGALGSASKLKVVTNYLCSVHLAALAEALTLCKVAGMDLNVAYEAIRISSGNSFVHETESQVILNGSRDINFTMDLVVKDVDLFNQFARELRVPLELAPLVLDIFKDGQRRYGSREFSPNIIRRLEESCHVTVLGRGFPAQLIDDEPEAPGYEVNPQRV